MPSELNIQKKAKIVGNYDVVICGGGPAGFIAALATRRMGARTALIERYGFLGGMATSAYVTPLSVFSYNNKRNIGGIPWEFVKRLEKMGGALIEEPLNNVAFDPELYKLCVQRMVLEAGIDLYMNSYITEVKKDKDNTIEAVFFENKNGTEAITGKVFIDATGDADISYLAGAPMQDWGKEYHLQPASMCFILSGVDTDSELVKNSMHHHLERVNCHCLPVRNKLQELKETYDIPTFGGPWFCTVLHPGSVAVNITRTEANSCDNRDFSSAEFRLREDVFKLTEILKKNFKEFKDCYVSATPAQAGIRESRHIRGMHIITTEEYVSAYKYPDSISRCAHPIDIHSSSAESQGCTFLEKAAYVPYRALIFNDYPNLIVPGRALSASKEAFASLRVQASCMGMGQAAGFAAQFAVEDNVSVQNIDIEKLVEKLEKTGAILG